MKRRLVIIKEFNAKPPYLFLDDGCDDDDYRIGECIEFGVYDRIDKILWEYDYKILSILKYV